VSTIIEYYDSKDRVEKQITVVFRKSPLIPGRWNVCRADNRRLLGWVNRPNGFGEYGKLWDSHVHPGAFLGTGPDDEGDVLDHVPGYLFNSPDGASCRAIGYDRSRFEAAYALVCWLRREQAPALGYGAHGAVRIYERD
jgi:hypothetical protein